jgi:DNA-directed RNA polymerase specialized sigma24 family protein
MEDVRDHARLPAKPRTQRYLRFRLEPADAALLEQMSEAQRAILLFNGSYQECSAALNIPVGTVRSRLHRARAALEALRQGRGVVDGRITQIN